MTQGQESISSVPVAPAVEQAIVCRKINGQWVVEIQTLPDVPLTDRDVNLLNRAIVVQHRQARRQKRIEQALRNEILSV